MNLKHPACCYWLISTYLTFSTIIALNHVTQALLDLNEEPEMEKEPVQATPKSGSSGAKAAQRAPTRQKVTPEFYKKVIQLLDILDMCNKENFNVAKINVPDSFEAQNKAMMALTKLGKANLIKEKDKPRYQRVMKNCLLLSKAVQAKTESVMSVDSQTSGGTYEDRMRRLRESPLDDFRERFRGAASGLRARLGGSKSNEPPSRTQTDRTLGNQHIINRSRAVVREFEPFVQNPTNLRQSKTVARNFIQFL